MFLFLRVVYRCFEWLGSRRYPNNLLNVFIGKVIVTTRTAKKLIETKEEDYVPAFDFARKAGIDLAGCIYMTN